MSCPRKTEPETTTTPFEAETSSLIITRTLATQVPETTVPATIETTVPSPVVTTTIVETRSTGYTKVSSTEQPTVGTGTSRIPPGTITGSTRPPQETTVVQPTRNTCTETTVTTTPWVGTSTVRISYIFFVISTYDFSTLYTKLPHDNLLNNLSKSVDFAFSGGNNKKDGNRIFLSIKGKSVFWTKKKHGKRAGADRI